MNFIKIILYYIEKYINEEKKQAMYEEECIADLFDKEEIYNLWIL